MLFSNKIHTNLALIAKLKFLFPSYINETPFWGGGGGGGQPMHHNIFN